MPEDYLLYKKVVKVGSSYGIVLSKHEREVNDINYGDIVIVKKQRSGDSVAS